jgi:hypothetical protein
MKLSELKRIESLIHDIIPGVKTFVNVSESDPLTGYVAFGLKRGKNGKSIAFEVEHE